MLIIESAIARQYHSHSQGLENEMHTDDLRVALLLTWRKRGLNFPVYGVLDAKELAIFGTAILTIDNIRWYVVTVEDVRVLHEVDVDDIVTTDWSEQRQ